jgi:hypothetical protein
MLVFLEVSKKCSLVWEIVNRNGIKSGGEVEDKKLKGIKIYNEVDGIDDLNNIFIDKKLRKNVKHELKLVIIKFS